MGDVRRDGTHGAILHPETRPRGEAHGMVKLTATDVHVIRSRLRRGDQQKDIAQAFGVNQPTISLIKNKHIWKHLPDTSQE